MVATGTTMLATRGVRIDPLAEREVPADTRRDVQPGFGYPHGLSPDIEGVLDPGQTKPHLAEKAAGGRGIPLDEPLDTAKVGGVPLDVPLPEVQLAADHDMVADTFAGTDVSADPPVILRLRAGFAVHPIPGRATADGPGEAAMRAGRTGGHGENREDQGQAGPHQNLHRRYAWTSGVSWVALGKSRLTPAEIEQPLPADADLAAERQRGVDHGLLQVVVSARPFTLWITCIP